MKREPTEWGNIFANYISNKGLITKILKEVIQQHQEDEQPNLKMSKGSEKTLLQKGHKWGQ